MEPPAGTQALLFDCDGTLVDTLSLYRVCWRHVYRRHGFDMADDWFYERVGLSVRPFVREAFPHASEAELDSIQHEGPGNNFVIDFDDPDGNKIELAELNAESKTRQAEARARWVAEYPEEGH